MLIKWSVCKYVDIYILSFMYSILIMEQFLHNKIIPAALITNELKIILPLLQSWWKIVK